MQPELSRGYVQRVTVTPLGNREVALLDIRIPSETVHLVCVAGVGIGILDNERWERLREAMRAVAAAGNRTQSLWRARFEGASVTRLSLGALECIRDGHALRAECGRRGALLVADGAMAHADAAPRALLEERGVAIADELAGAEISGRRSALEHALAKAISRIRRRVAAVQGDVARIESADALAMRARLFVAAARTAPRGADRLRTVDWTRGAPEEVELSLDPARGAREQIDGLFKRARRLKEGARIARARLAEAETSLAALQSVSSDLAGFDPNMASLEARGRAAAPMDFKLAQTANHKARKQANVPRPPYRVFEGATGARILVGRGAAHNDELTLRVARPHDLWLHAKDAHGAHVVVPLQKGTSCPPGWLVEAAHLAVHFSDLREERIADVQYTSRRYLRKPRGSPPGLVTLDREKVIVLRKNDELLRKLLQGEIV